MQQYTKNISPRGSGLINSNFQIMASIFFPIQNNRHWRYDPEFWIMKSGVDPSKRKHCLQGHKARRNIFRFLMSCKTNLAWNAKAEENNFTHAIVISVSSPRFTIEKQCNIENTRTTFLLFSSPYAKYYLFRKIICMASMKQNMWDESIFPMVVAERIAR